MYQTRNVSGLLYLC